MNKSIIAGGCSFTLGNELSELGDFAGAKACYQRALAGYEKSVGKEDISTIHIVNNLAGVLKNLGSLQEAKVLYNRSLAGYRKILGDDDPETLGAADDLDSLLETLGEKR